MAQTVLAAAASSWAVVMGIAPVLQIRRMLRAQSSREVSVGYFTVLLIGFQLWVAYGAAAGIMALVISNTVALVVGAVVIVALRIRRQPAGKSSPPPDHRRQRQQRSAPRTRSHAEMSTSATDRPAQKWAICALDRKGVRVMASAPSRRYTGGSACRQTGCTHRLYPP